MKQSYRRPPLEPTTFWDPPRQSYGRNKKGDNKYRGVTPAAVIYNLVQRYTEPGDLVVDPMCGSGTTIDVCKEEGRRVIGYDIVPVREDIIQGDARKIALEDDSVDMVFVDFPYGDNIHYNDHPDDIGKISCETEKFYDELEKVAVECHRILRPGKVFACMMGDQDMKHRFTAAGFKLLARLQNHFELKWILQVGRRSQTSHTALWIWRARQYNFFLMGFKWLFILQKPSREHTTGDEDEISDRELAQATELWHQDDHENIQNTLNSYASESV
jgi:DNA modification methylase